MATALKGKKLEGKKYFITATIEELMRAEQNGEITTKLMSNGSDIQRNAVWTKKQKEDFIDTLFQFGEGLSIVYLVEGEDGIKSIEDGKQKFTTIKSFVNNEFKLGKMRLVDGTDISGKNFNELPMELKERFLEAEIDMKVFRYESDKQVEEIFIKLNGGEKLRPMEKMRAILSKEIPFLQEIAGTKYFIENIKFDKSQRTRFADIDLALGLLLEEFHPGSDQNKKYKEQFANSLKEETFFITEKGKTIVSSKLKYLNAIFSGMFDSKQEELDVRKVILKSTNRIILYRIAKDCFNAKYKSEHVYDFMKYYFNQPGAKYSDIAGNASTSNKTSLDKRYEHLSKAMKRYMKKNGY